MKRTRQFIGLIILACVSLWLTRGIVDFVQNKQFYNDYKAEYEQEKKRNVELQTHLVKVQDTHQFEKTVRNRLNFHKSNERILIIPNPTPTIVIPSPTPVPNYKQWADVFINGS